MKKSKIYLLYSLFLITCCNQIAYSFTDPYPKNPNIDAVNYKFEFELSDHTDEILGTATIDIRFLVDGIKTLRLDLIKKSSILGHKGMHVTVVKSDGESSSHFHKTSIICDFLPTQLNVKKAF